MANNDGTLSPREVLRLTVRAFRDTGKGLWILVPSMLILALGGLLSSLFSAWLLRGVLDAAINDTFAQFFQAASVFLLLYALFAVLSGLGQYGIGHIKQGYKRNMCIRALVSYMHLPETVLRDRHSGDIISRIDSDTSESAEMVGYIFTGMVGFRLVGGISGLLVIMAIDWRLAVLSVALGLLQLLFTVLFSKPTARYATQLQEGKARMNERISDILAGAVPIRVYGLADKLTGDYTAIAEQVAHTGVRQSRLRVMQRTLAQLVQWANRAGVMILGGVLAARGELYLPDLMYVIGITWMVSMLISGFGDAWNYLCGASASAKRVYDVVDEPREDLREEQPELTPVEGAPAIELQNVIFSYREGAPPVLEDVSLTVRHGEVVALVGESGSGKTTLFSLLLGFFTPDAGDIRLFGVSRKSCQLPSWRQQLAWVQQESPAVDATVGQNIAMGALHRHALEDAPHADIQEAAIAANAHDFIEQMPDKYASAVGELGGALSGGQRQRISIARALYRKAPILLLDEATSALDMESEALVQQSLERAIQSHTVLVAAHRLSTIRRADRIVVMGDGRILEEGTHDELIQKDSHYAALWRAQFAARAGDAGA